MTSYSDKLKDPRWQKMRLKVLERDDFTCPYCGNGENDKIPLHVHHLYYKKNCDPWNYDIESLQTVCQFCHEGISIDKKLMIVGLRAVFCLSGSGLSYSVIRKIMFDFINIADSSIRNECVEGKKYGKN